MRTSLLSCLLALTLTQACAGGGAAPSPGPGPGPAQSTPSDPAATAATRAVLAFLAAHSTGTSQGTVVGQNCGHGSQIADASNAYVSFHALVESLHDQSGRWVGMIGIDYEHDLIFTPAQLSTANAVLVAHWRRGGLVTVNWAPQNPWLNDESDLAKDPGVWTNTRTTGNNLEHVDLDALVDPTSAIYPVWRRKLDRVAAALAELRDAGVVVLWRPMQEMNGSWFWWGWTAKRTDAGPYQRVWRDMYRYFTEEKQLHNLLWVFSPADAGGQPASRDYPGDAFVDVLGPTYYGNALQLQHWKDYVGFGKPVGLAELGTTDHSTEDQKGTFDDRLYLAAVKERYPQAAFFHAWHDWDWGDGTSAHKSLHANQHAVELLQDAGVLTADELPAFE